MSGLPSRQNLRPSPYYSNNSDSYRPSYSSHTDPRSTYDNSSYSRPPPSQSSSHSTSHHSSRPLRPQQSLPSLRSRPKLAGSIQEPVPMEKPRGKEKNDGVLARMQEAGWMDVGPSEDEKIPMVSNGVAPAYDRSISRESADSGYGENDEKPEAGYLGSWTKLKKVVWGEEGEPTTVLPITFPKTLSDVQSSGLWEKLVQATSIATHNVSDSVARARGDDDDHVGADGETKLGRVIKEYHISRVSSADELPNWLFSPVELAARSRAATREKYASGGWEEDASVYSSRSQDRTSQRSVPQASRRTPIDDFQPTWDSTTPSSSSKTANRLRQMREEKRNQNGR